MHVRAGEIFHGLFVNPHLSLESGSCEPRLDENPIGGRAATTPLTELPLVFLRTFEGSGSFKGGKSAGTVGYFY